MGSSDWCRVGPGGIEPVSRVNQATAFFKISRSSTIPWVDGDRILFAGDIVDAR
jgi:hypothetical protein